jgi:hypothetical protein
VSRTLLVLAGAVTIALLIAVFATSGRGFFAEPIRDSASERTDPFPGSTPALVDSDEGTDLLVLAEHDERSPVEESSKDRSEEAWIPSAPDLPLHEMTGREVLAAYWGDRWPEVEAHLGERLELVDGYWARSQESLGQPEDVLDGLVDEILATLDGLGGTPRRIASICMASPSPFKYSSTFSEVEREAMRIAQESGRPIVELSKLETLKFESRVVTASRGLEPEWIAMDAAVRRLVVEQLTGLDRFTQPRLGHLTLCPLMDYGPPADVDQALRDAGGRSRWFAPFIAFAPDRMQCKFVALWCIDLATDPVCARAIERIEYVESVVAAELSDIAAEMAAAMQQ